VSCGALLNVEPHGDDAVFGMCHTIEDPTFDATAYATNPRARIRPVHRPPRVPADRVPHCHWTIEIDPENEPVGPARLTRQVAALPLASLSIEARPPDDGYDRPFDPAFRLADCSDATLHALMREFAIQTHLLMASVEIAFTERYGTDVARNLVGDAWLATAWVTSERMRLDVADTLRWHPAIPPGFERTIEHNGRHVRCALRPESAALLDADQPGWVGAIARGDRRGVEGMIRPVDRRATFDLHVDQSIVIDVELAALSEREAPKDPPVLAFMRVGSLAAFEFASQ
jgi:hypothetical protein